MDDFTMRLSGMFAGTGISMTSEVKCFADKGKEAKESYLFLLSCILISDKFF